MLGSLYKPLWELGLPMMIYIASEKKEMYKKYTHTQGVREVGLLIQAYTRKVATLIEETLV